MLIQLINQTSVNQHPIYLITTKSLAKHIEIKIKKETSKLLDGLKSPW
ncbi:hypothetical protein I6F65_14875 [Pseudoalteromonas sp. SWXJZ94C]|nr:hypothetical protein [Pseudoalteromonas sp. SWXJZ94C]MBH0058243.1 hypothetical protein [Pseudoalteromonas sp. SWXJZ94C]